MHLLIYLFSLQINMYTLPQVVYGLRSIFEKLHIFQHDVHNIFTPDTFDLSQHLINTSRNIHYIINNLNIDGINRQLLIEKVAESVNHILKNPAINYNLTDAEIFDLFNHGLDEYSSLLFPTIEIDQLAEDFERKVHISFDSITEPVAQIPHSKTGDIFRQGKVFKYIGTGVWIANSDECESPHHDVCFKSQSF